jgi:AraC-like DNA-binding protein/tellurite resistance-related uncharacterized protein
MRSGFISKLNKMQVSFESSSDIPKVLWIMAASENNMNSLTFSSHAHAAFELHVVLSGCVKYKIGEEYKTICAEEFMIISPQKIHSVYECSESFVKITLAFYIDSTSKLYKSLKSQKTSVFSMSEDMLKCFDFIIKFTAGELGAPLESAKIRLVESIYHAAGTMNALRFEKRREELIDQRIYRAKKHIDDNPQIFFTCEETAAFCHISAKQLSRLFLKFEGISLFEYIHRKKLENAKSLLLSTKLKEAEIASSLGFSSVQYFSKFFLKYEGITPLVYRRKEL